MNGVTLGAGSKENSPGTRNGRTEGKLRHLRSSLRHKLDGDQMPIGHFEFWFDALANDDHALARSILEEYSQSSGERRVLVDGRFVYNCRPHHLRSQRDVDKLICPYQRPLVLTAIFRAESVLQLFLEVGADLCVQDVGSSTVIHGIIRAAALKPNYEVVYVRIYEFLISKLTMAQRRHLLFLEDSDGLRPLELAARFHTFLLFKRLLDTEGVYLFRHGILGAHMCTWYDVTDYESWEHGKRRQVSPLRMFTVMEKEFLPSAKNTAFIHHPAIQKWTNSKILTNVPYLCAWFCVRLTYTALIFVCAVADENHSWKEQTITMHTSGNSTVSPFENTCPEPILILTHQRKTILTTMVMCFSVMILVFDFTEAGLYYFVHRPRDRRLYHAFGSRNFVVRTRFYRVCNFLLAASVLMFHSSRLLDTNTRSPVTSKAYMLANILNIWSLLFFIQFVPALGYFVTIIQRMLKDMFHFLVLYVILFFSFSQTFFTLFYMNQICSKDFTNLWWSMYSTFRVMLNMIDLTEEFQDTTDIAILHTIYVIVVPILLVNFLIALMSNSVSDVAENRYLIMFLQRLSAAILVESRLGKLIPFVYRWQQLGYYVVNDGRVYVECFVLKDSR